MAGAGGTWSQVHHCQQWCTSVSHSHLILLFCGLCFPLYSCPWPFLVSKRGARDGSDCTVIYLHWTGHGRRRWSLLVVVCKLPKGSQVPFLADAFPAALAVSGQLSSYADNFFSSPSFLSMVSLKLPASNRSLIAQGDEACCTQPHREPLPVCLVGHGSVCCCSLSLSLGGRSLEVLSTEMCCSLLRGQDLYGHQQV